MTAPPDDNAVKRKIRTVLNDVTSETPETSASLEKLTTKVSAIPTNIKRNCSTKSGKINLRKSLFENITFASILNIFSDKYNYITAHILYQRIYSL